ncbi:Uncharacterised protein [BD1-7 clade bacterium]|uniref:dUTP diphosphatase n=1 Tax=BD1-7 clade bacterium TaxID=2029982 RepID=A0A5S9P1T0_9GAMM|nr:Uncharacterised protein [BD1-7 clade bacterium]CAA0116489.1 Uncharacterised protein [BD1-7 clade bacterium]CAA0120125.1 Uncharacterised protein [BD1-7 clade bacterium]
MQTELEVMLALQDKMNQKVHPDWINQDFAWFRAIWIECGELVDHYGYKWWKKQTPEMAQVQLEIVDIWHFGLSMLIDGRNYAEIANEIQQALASGVVAQLEVIDATEALAGAILTTREFSVNHFWALLVAADMSFDDLFKQYVGKNVLNFFRQDNGYKDGSYIKVWDGREDNEHLTDILLALDASGANFADQVYSKLQERYPA